MKNHIFVCDLCGKPYPLGESRYRCDCHGTLSIKNLALDKLSAQALQKKWTSRITSPKLIDISGVWRYRELILPLPSSSIITRPEGNTHLYPVGQHEKGGFGRIGKYTGIDTLYLKHEGENPTGSFKDRGMTAGISYAYSLGMTHVACASTGNTSASLASYAAQAGMKCTVYIPEGKISSGKLAQSLAYGATIQQVKGDFDLAMKTVEETANKKGIYLLNSLNPFRIEGQKAIAFEIIQQLNWKSPDWIVLPAGNLGNTAAIGKGLIELHQLGLITQVPRIASIQAENANPFYLSFKTSFAKQFRVHAETVASAIRIGNPVSFHRAASVIQQTDGIVEEVTDKEILHAKKYVDSSGIGCEPASAASIAGLKKLFQKKIIKKSDIVVGVLTGNILKDPEIIIQTNTNSL